MIERLKLLRGPFAIACLWFGTHVGPGFAGGAQLVSYFVAPSWIGVIIGPLLLSFLAMYTTYWRLEYSRVFQLYDWRSSTDKLWGPLRHIFSNLKEVTSLLGAIVIASLTFATGGTLLEEMFGVPYFWGGLGTVILVVVLVMFGQKMVTTASTFITIALIALVLYIGFRGLLPAWDGMKSFVASRYVNPNYSYLSHSYRILIYISLFCSFVDSGAAASKGIIKSKKDSLATAVMGGVMIGGCIILMNIMFAAGMPEVESEALPTLWVLQNLVKAGPSVQIIYTVLAYLAIISTGVGFLYGVIYRYDVLLSKVLFKENQTLRYALITGAIMATSILFGQFGILWLVNYGYVMLGNINVPAFYLPLMVLQPYQIHRYNKQQKAMAAEAEAPSVQA